jgi:hypothetical protein
MDGYWKPKHFWELPLWIGEVTYAFQRGTLSQKSYEVNLHIITSTGEALPDADVYCFSVLDDTKPFVKYYVQLLRHKAFFLGGYVDPAYFKGCPNVRWCDSVEDLCDYCGVVYEYGVNWKLFRGETCIPRLRMSSGCYHTCKFCTIPNKVTQVPWEDVLAQVDAMKDLRFRLVYLDDKTWGMAANHQRLDSIYSKIRAFNPDFEGFVIQTSVAWLDMQRRQDGGLESKLNEMRLAGVKIIELGIETYNNTILEKLNKPQREHQITDIVEELHRKGFKVIANIILGLPGESSLTYSKTLGWLYSMYRHLYGININTLALYHDSKLGKELGGPQGQYDTDQLGDVRSFWTDEETLAYQMWRDRFYIAGILTWSRATKKVQTEI